jgi:hypothetical protein
MKLIQCWGGLGCRCLLNLVISSGTRRRDRASIIEKVVDHCTLCMPNSQLHYVFLAEPIISAHILWSWQTLYVQIPSWEKVGMLNRLFLISVCIRRLITCTKSGATRSIEIISHFLSWMHSLSQIFICVVIIVSSIELLQL